MVLSSGGFSEWEIVEDFKALQRQLVVVKKALSPSNWQNVTVEFKEHRAKFLTSFQKTNTAEMSTDENSDEYNQMWKRWEEVIYAEYLKRKITTSCNYFGDVTLLMTTCRNHLLHDAALCSKFETLMSALSKQDSDELDRLQFLLTESKDEIINLHTTIEGNKKRATAKFVAALHVMRNICNEQDRVRNWSAWKFIVSEGRKERIQVANQKLQESKDLRAQDALAHCRDAESWDEERRRLNAQRDHYATFEKLYEDEQRTAKKFKDDVLQANEELTSSEENIVAMKLKNTALSEEIESWKHCHSEETKRAETAEATLANETRRLEDALKDRQKLYELAARFAELEKTLATTQTALEEEKGVRQIRENRIAELEGDLDATQQKELAAQREIARLHDVIAREQKVAAERESHLEEEIRSHISQYEEECAAHAHTRAEWTATIDGIQEEAHVKTELDIQKYKDEVAEYIHALEGKEDIQRQELEKLEELLPAVQALNSLPSPPSGAKCHLCQRSIVWSPDQATTSDAWRAYQISTPKADTTHD